MTKLGKRVFRRKGLPAIRALQWAQNQNPRAAIPPKVALKSQEISSGLPTQKLGSTKKPGVATQPKSGTVTNQKPKAANTARPKQPAASQRPGDKSSCKDGQNSNEKPKSSRRPKGGATASQKAKPAQKPKQASAQTAAVRAHKTGAVYNQNTGVTIKPAAPDTPPQKEAVESWLQGNKPAAAAPILPAQPREPVVESPQDMGNSLSGSSDQGRHTLASQSSRDQAGPGRPLLQPATEPSRAAPRGRYVVGTCWFGWSLVCLHASMTTCWLLRDCLKVSQSHESSYGFSRARWAWAVNPELSPSTIACYILFLRSMSIWPSLIETGVLQGNTQICTR